MAEPTRANRLVVDDAQPLIAVPLDDEGERVAYYTSEAEAVAAITDDAVNEALALAGAWAELDWDELEAALHEIRHRNPPSPPIERLEDLLGHVGDEGAAGREGA